MTFGNVLYNASRWCKQALTYQEQRVERVELGMCVPGKKFQYKTNSASPFHPGCYHFQFLQETVGTKIVTIYISIGKAF